MTDRNIQWQIKAFAELTVTELYDILQARSDVFVVEQTCIYSDMDGVDKLPDCYQLFAYDGDQLVGTCRLIAKGIAYDEYCAIGRVLITDSYRGKKLAAPMMEAAIAEVQRLWPTTKCKISAQQHLENFYESVGFETVTEMYLEDDIPHIGMILN
ncbi:GNAT family N-acetyltransferase [Psychrosphaera haliotis]|uniref:GNAT family N-acetyltransferase n=1 Tax=Psychrosphaera haliotis TaxID=555083 RepID=UPI0012DAB042|nr:GNAT family N-acetyltransferase [Psychrosphaera haliotis]